MTKRAQGERMVIGAFLCFLLLFLLYGLTQARTQVRDNLRQQDIADLKRAAEQYNNEFGFYPTSPSEDTGCTESSPESWLFGESSPLVTGYFINAIPHDVRESRGHNYRYCVTEVTNKKTSSYFFEAQLEIAVPPTRSFDEDERRKFDYRILHDDDKTLYRVCGGDEEQCKAI